MNLRIVLPRAAARRHRSRAGGNSVIAVHTASDGLRFYWNQYGTNNWHGEQVAADGETVDTAANLS